FGLRLSLFSCERLFGAPIGVSLRDHDVEDCLTTLFSGFNQVVLAKFGQVVLKPFVLLLGHAALGDIDGEAGEMRGSGIARFRSGIAIVSAQLLLMLDRTD